jgi:uncharacterized protein (TIGR00299 family) protein
VSARDEVAYLDCSTGVSGDKLLGALLDLGELRGDFTAQDLRAIVATLAPEARVDVSRVLSHGISAISVSVSADGDAKHRHWADIEALIGGANLPEAVKTAALGVFVDIATHEARIHGTDLDHVHFHEVGAIDSIVDIVGVCAGVHALGLLGGGLICGPIAVGSGTVATSHGILPVPAPATAALLAGAPIVAGPAAGELTTPTGAALVMALAAFGTMPAMTIDRLGYGAGTRDIGMPNICRIMLGEPMAASASASVSAEPTSLLVLLETNIDHIPAEELAFAAQELLAAGALDVWQTPIVMKKGRSAVMLSVLAAPDAADELVARAIALTGSLGVRRSIIERTCVPREVREVATPWGTARVKLGAGRVRPEHDDVARIAREHGLPYATVAREIARIAEA